MENEPVLFVYIDQRRWYDVIARSASHPDEARYEEDGCTAVHCACFYDPPMEVITALLHAFPGATSVQDINGDTALHHACIYSSHTVVRKLLQSKITGISVRNVNNQTPLKRLCWECDAKLRGALNNISLPSPNTKIQNVKIANCFDSCLAHDKVLSRICKIANLLVMATYHESVEEILPDGKEWHILHACAGIKDCPSNFLRIAMKIHPDALNVSDEEGNLPLHIAAAATSLSLEDEDNSAFVLEHDLESEEGGNDDEEDEMNTIELLVNAHPTASKIRNNQNKLPLQIAIKSRAPPRETKMILEANPAALACLDIDYRFYPLVLNFLGCKISNPLTALFVVLREIPALTTSSGYRQNCHEFNHKKKKRKKSSNHACSAIRSFSYRRLTRSMLSMKTRSEWRRRTRKKLVT